MFNINGETWDVVAVSPKDYHLRRSDGDFSIGVCDDVLKTIFISSNLSYELLKRVLCHEITHAAMFSYNIELDLKQEEFVADLMATHGQEIIQVTNQIYKKIKGAYFE